MNLSSFGYIWKGIQIYNKKIGDSISLAEYPVVSVYNIKKQNGDLIEYTYSNNTVVLGEDVDCAQINILVVG